MLNTTNPNNYEYKTQYLKIHILGGIKTNKPALRSLQLRSVMSNKSKE